MTSLKAHVMRHLFVLALLPRVFPATTPTTSDTPINTCCPPGHFLAIEDLQQSKQDPDGDWQRLRLPDNFHAPWTPDRALDEELHHALRPRYEDLKNAPRKAAFTESFLAREWYDLIGDQGRNRWDRKLERHQYISRVFCVPDKNDLPSIDGLSGSSLPSPPYFASTEAWRQDMSIESRVLAEDQVLQSKGLKATEGTWFPFFCSRLPPPFLPRRTSRVGHDCSWKRWVCRSQQNSTYVQVNQVAIRGGKAIPLLSCGSMRKDCWSDGIWM